MLRSIPFSLLIVLPTLLTACGDKHEESKSTASPAGFHGSCTLTTTGQTRCTEYLTPEESRGQLCGMLQGTWSDAPCDRKQYALGCKQESKVSTDGGPEVSVVTISWKKESDEIGCLGEEIKPDGTPVVK